MGTTINRCCVKVASVGAASVLCLWQEEARRVAMGRCGESGGFVPKDFKTADDTDADTNDNTTNSTTNNTTP